jgi:hypothetical protein
VSSHRVIRFEEDGRKVRVYTELLGGKTGRAIHVSSIRKYKPPHDGELLTDERSEEILDLARNTNTGELDTK